MKDFHFLYIIYLVFLYICNQNIKIFIYEKINFHYYRNNLALLSSTSRPCGIGNPITLDRTCLLKFSLSVVNQINLEL